MLDMIFLLYLSLLYISELYSGDANSTMFSLLLQACLDSGFFYVINHGISEEFMNEVFFQSRKFFDLSLHKKMELLRNEKHRGYTPTLDETLDPENQVHGLFPILLLLRSHL